MTENHVFIDMANNRIVGKSDNIVKAWKPFFRLYPGYRNIFESVTVNGSYGYYAGIFHLFRSGSK